VITGAVQRESKKLSQTFKGIYYSHFAYARLKCLTENAITWATLCRTNAPMQGQQIIGASLCHACKPAATSYGAPLACASKLAALTESLLNPLRWLSFRSSFNS
jgi:hypothetical protein